MFLSNDDDEDENDDDDVLFNVLLVVFILFHSSVSFVRFYSSSRCRTLFRNYFMESDKSKAKINVLLQSDLPKAAFQ